MNEMNFETLIEKIEEDDFESFELKMDTIHNAMNIANSIEQWDMLIDCVGQRTISHYAVDNATEYSHNPNEASGIAIMEIDGNNCLIAEWSDSGNYYVSIASIEEGKVAIADYNAQWYPEYPDDDWLPENDNDERF